MTDLTSVAGLVKTAKDIQRPVSLAALMMIILLIIFHQIVGRIRDVDQTILPAIVNWLGVITVITVVLGIASYMIPYFLKGRSGTLVVGGPRQIPPSPVGPPPRKPAKGDKEN